jgi:hypothetical protein
MRHHRVRHRVSAGCLAAFLTAVVPVAASAQTSRAPKADGPLRDGVSRSATAIAQGGGATSQPKGDSNADGIAAGALIGAGAMFLTTVILFARCDEGCEAPEPGPFYLWSAGVGAGAGALTGWLIDRAHRSGNRQVRIVPVVTPRRQAVRIAVKF